MAALYSSDPSVPVESIQTLEALRAGRLASPALNAALVGIFAGLALLITLAGLSAVIATSVSQRGREFGVRMALGASRTSVVKMVLRQGWKMNPARKEALLRDANAWRAEGRRAAALSGLSGAGSNSPPLTGRVCFREQLYL